MSERLFLTADEAEEAFYTAFEARDIERMMQVWATDEEISCIHPGGARLDTRSAIQISWGQIFSVETEGLRFKRAEIRRNNDGDLAIHLVKEHISMQGELQGIALATNVYRRSGHGWHMIVHHASAEPARRDEWSDHAVH